MKGVFFYNILIQRYKTNGYFVYYFILLCIFESDSGGDNLFKKSWKGKKLKNS